MERVKAFLKRKQVVISVQTYLIDALGAMAFGLFASLLIGTIFGTLGEKTGVVIFTTIAGYAKSATGAALGVSIAYALKAPTLVLFSAATVGIAGNELGGPVGALVATIIAAELGKIVSKETPVDILVTPGRHHHLRYPGRTVCRSGRLRIHDRFRKSGEDSDRHAAAFHGYSGFCPDRHRPDASDQQCGNLHHVKPRRSGRRCRHRRLLRADGRICRFKLL